MMKITLKDTDFAGKVLNEVLLEFETKEVTVKEIIEERVTFEVEQFNAKLPNYFKGLIMPNDAIQTAEGYQVKNKSVIDVEKQIYVALNAFKNNGFFILVDDLQVEKLEAKVKLDKQMDISFVKLTPLVGG